MTKQSKRTRKFQATGGIKGRLEKGTITKKGKLKRRGKAPGSAATRLAPKNTVGEGTNPDRSDDFVGTKNLGDLDIDSFFEQFADGVEGDDDNEFGDADTDDEVDASRSERKGENQDEINDDEDVSNDNSSADDDLKRNSNTRLQPNVVHKIGKHHTSESSDDSDSDDEDVATSEALMKSELLKLKESDPEFHKYLAENEQSLLEYGDNVHSDNDEDSNLQSAEVEIDEVVATSNAVQDNARTLTLDTLKSLERGVFESHGIKSLKKLMSAYRTACHLADSAGTNNGNAGPGEGGTMYTIESSEVFDQLMMLCLNRFHEAFSYHLLDQKPDASSNDKGKQASADHAKADDIDVDDPEQNERAIPAKTIEKSLRWADVKLIVMSFFRSTLHILGEAKEPELVTFVLRAIAKYLRFLSPFPRIAEAMLRVFTTLWSAPFESSESFQVVRLNAFLRIRQLALSQPFPFIEDVLKKTYLSYARRAKLGGGSSMLTASPTLTFMGNCLVELYSLDYQSSYQHAFVYIRQLALLLRTSMTKKTKESFQAVYCWQYIHCLKLWVAVLSAACPADDSVLMKSLLYPLVEITLGTVRLGPSPSRFLPLRFHCVRMLQQLAAASEVFIPTTSILLDVLDWKEWILKPKKTRGNATQGIDMTLLIRLPKEDTLRSHEQLEAGMSEFFVLLQREIELYRYSPGFPEYSVRIVTRLKTFAKETRNTRWRSYARGCIDACDRYSAFAVQARANLAEAPKDVRTLESIRPPSQPTMRIRHQIALDKAQKALESNRLLHARTHDKKRKEVVSDDESAEDGESTGDNESHSDEDAERAPAKKKNKKRKNQDTKPTPVKTPSHSAENLLEEADAVQEGIDWSDED